MPEQPFIPLAPLLSVLGILLALSLMVERFLMIVGWIIDRLFLLKKSLKWETIEQKESELALLEKALVEEKVLAQSPAKAKKAAADPREIEPFPGDEQAEKSDSRFDIKKFELPAELKVAKEFWLQILGVFIAVLGCYIVRFSIWNLVVWSRDLSQPLSSQAEFWEYIISGIIIGAGSKPVHFLMNFLVNRRIVVAREEVKEKLLEPLIMAPPRRIVPKKPPLAVAPPEAPLRLEDVIGFEYDGGDRPERLETTHLRKKPIDLIVYHHTAMHSDSPFEEIIREFDRKGWLTGYHCIIMKDGTIRVLCRWDRFGNHVRGYNQTSLGISLHGNFEPNPRVPFSNPDGRMGIMHPTPIQLENAAKIVALWSILYQVPLDFNKSILPHRKLAPKACPGANFPQANFIAQVTDYHAKWSADQKMLDAIQRFSLNPMVKA